MKENGKNTKFKSWNGLGFMKNPKLYIPVAIFLGIVVVGIAGLVIWKPGIVRGEYDVQSIVDMLLNH